MPFKITYYFFILILFILQCLDIYSTYLSISFWNIELNFIINYIINSWGYFFMALFLFVKLYFLPFIFIHINNDYLKWWKLENKSNIFNLSILIFICFFTSLVVLNNLINIF